jgi:hypothetical protein
MMTFLGLSLVDIHVFDPDAGNKPILVTVTVVDSTGRLDLEGNDEAFKPRVVNGISLPPPCSRLVSDSGVSSYVLNCVYLLMKEEEKREEELFFYLPKTLY